NIDCTYHYSNIHTIKITKIVTHNINNKIKHIKSIVSQREIIKNYKPTISMSLSHCIHQTLNSKASTRFHSGGLQQSRTLILNTVISGRVILNASVHKRAVRTQLAATVRKRLLVL